MDASVGLEEMESLWTKLIGNVNDFTLRLFSSTSLLRKISRVISERIKKWRVLARELDHHFLMKELW